MLTCAAAAARLCTSSEVYPVDGGMEDWSYAAGWEPSPQPISVCRPTTYGGYAEEGHGTWSDGTLMSGLWPEFHAVFWNRRWESGTPCNTFFGIMEHGITHLCIPMHLQTD